MMFWFYIAILFGVGNCYNKTFLEFMNEKINPYIFEWLLLIHEKSENIWNIFYLSPSRRFIFKNYFSLDNEIIDVLLKFNNFCFNGKKNVGLIISSHKNIFKDIPKSIYINLGTLITSNLKKCLYGKCVNMLKINFVRYNNNGYIVLSCKPETYLKVLLTSLLAAVDIVLLYYVMLIITRILVMW